MTQSSPPRFIGVVHLLPLPGSPSGGASLDEVVDRALTDTHALVNGGADGVIVENYGDAPFAAGPVCAYTVAAMTRVAWAVRRAAPDLELGINVLRNDAIAAVSIAATVGADFIRVNVHTGAMVTDQGLLTGTARATLLERRRLGAERVRIAADVMVKHAVPLGDQTLETAARDCHGRGHADALIVTGTGTGEPTSADDLIRVRAAVPEARIWVGSGATPDNLEALRPHVDGLIVGTWLHENADTDRPLDPKRVRAFRNALST